MIVVIRHRKRRDTLHRCHGTDMDGILVHVGMARSVSVDVLPCLDGIERQFIRGYSDDGAVLVVQLFVLQRQAASEKSEDAGERADGVEFGSWEFGQRVQEEVEDGTPCCVSYELSWSMYRPC